jgi:hypothetical protein
MYSTVSCASVNNERSKESPMQGLDFWRLCDELSIVQAALLIAGSDPSSDGEYVEGWSPESRPIGYEAAKTAISSALRRGTIKGQLVPHFEHDINGYYCGAIEGSINVKSSQVEVESLRAWLRGRGLQTGFFFPKMEVAQDYLDSHHPRFAPKLAAAVLAWLATASESATRGKSPKQALTKWLREHASEFGLTDDDGKPNETGIEEAAKVANWQPSGGAPKTPGG